VGKPPSRKTRNSDLSDVCHLASFVFRSSTTNFTVSLHLPASLATTCSTPSSKPSSPSPEDSPPKLPELRRVRPNQSPCFDSDLPSPSLCLCRFVADLILSPISCLVCDPSRHDPYPFVLFYRCLVQVARRSSLLPPSSSLWLSFPLAPVLGGFSRSRWCPRHRRSLLALPVRGRRKADC
jgi:hypothetical protein